MDRNTAFTVLPPLSPRLPQPPRTPSPNRIAPLGLHQKDAFVILSDVGEPYFGGSGRSSPFRGRGFREPSPASKIPVATGKSAPASPAKAKRTRTGRSAGLSAPASPSREPPNKRPGVRPASRRRNESPSKIPQGKRESPSPALKDAKSPKRVNTRPAVSRPGLGNNKVGNRPPLPGRNNEDATSRPGHLSRVRSNNNINNNNVNKSRSASRNASQTNLSEAGLRDQPKVKRFIESPTTAEEKKNSRFISVKQKLNGFEAGSDHIRDLVNKAATGRKRDVNDNEGTAAAEESQEMEAEEEEEDEVGVIAETTKEATPGTPGLGPKNPSRSREVSPLMARKTEEKTQESVSPGKRSVPSTPGSERPVRREIPGTPGSKQTTPRGSRKLTNLMHAVGGTPKFGRKNDDSRSSSKASTPTGTPRAKKKLDNESPTPKARRRLPNNPLKTAVKSHMLVRRTLTPGGSPAGKPPPSPSRIPNNLINVQIVNEQKPDDKIVENGQMKITSSPSMERSQPDVIPNEDSVAMDAVGSIKEPPEVEVEAGNSHSNSVRSPEIRPESLKKPRRFWKGMKAGTLIPACFKPGSRIGERTGDGLAEQDSERRGPLLGLCTFGKLKRKVKKNKDAKEEAAAAATAAEAKAKEKPKRVMPKCPKCPTPKCPSMKCPSLKCPTVKCPKCPSLSCGPCCAKFSSGCRSFWRKVFCLDMACCSKCKPKPKAPKPKPQQPPPDRMREKRGSEKRNSFAGFPKLDPTLVEHTSTMKGAIPVLHSALAWTCLFLNIFLPGIGTIMSGFLCLCFGKPRFSVNDSAHARLGSFCINLIVGFSQLFTIVFCFVGWGWSIWWGIIMIKVARKNSRLKQAEKNGDGIGRAAVNPNQDVERAGR